MQATAYDFRSGAVFQTGATRDAQIVGEHIEMLRKEYQGKFTPRHILQDARNPNSPLHSFFEWDDSAGAEKHRLQQARGLIRAVVVTYRDEEKEEDLQPVAAFVHIPKGEDSHYESTAEAMSEKETRELILRRAWREFQSWRKRYEQLDEFGKLFDVADQLDTEID